jgi:hypothetical protein
VHTVLRHSFAKRSCCEAAQELACYASCISIHTTKATLHSLYDRMDANTATFYDITGDMKRPMLMQLSPFVLALTQRVLDVQALFVECTSAL